MPHQFTRNDDNDLEGVWLKSNGRKFCSWRYDADSGTLKASRGVVVRTATLQAETRSIAELKEELPHRALELAKEIRQEIPPKH